jgi:hypothetical protein
VATLLNAQPSSPWLGSTLKHRGSRALNNLHKVPFVSVVAVCDAYDAMLTERPGVRASLVPEEAGSVEETSIDTWVAIAGRWTT